MKRRRITAICIQFITVFISFVYLPTAAYSLDCQFEQSPEQAVNSAQAIFIGKAVEERSVPMSTKGGTSLGYKEVKFEVTRSWKLIDKRTVWIRIAAKRGDDCGFESTGHEYLVYANQMNDVLYISPMSRTMPTDLAGRDMVALGTEYLHISEGEFALYDFKLWVVAGVFGLILLIGACFILARVWKV